MIREVISAVSPFVSDIIVIDDGCSDHTALYARDMGAIVLSHVINCGQGAALQTGLDYAYLQGADIVVTFDADGQFEASEIPSLIDILIKENVDFVKGSRFLGKKANMEKYRFFCLQCAILFTQLITGKRFSDVHVGFMAFSRRGIQQIRIEQQPRMAHGSEILSQVVKKKVPFREIPITVKYTSYSRAKGQKFTDYLKILRDLFLGSFKSLL